MNEQFNEQEMTRTLRQRAEAAVPERSDWWPQISQQAEAIQPTPPAMRPLPNRNLALMALSTAAVLLAVGVLSFALLAPRTSKDAPPAVAAAPATQPAPPAAGTQPPDAQKTMAVKLQQTPDNAEPSVRDLDQYNREARYMMTIDTWRRATNLDLSQQVGAYTVTIKKVYVDRIATRVLYTIKGPDVDKCFKLAGEPTLKVAGGQTFAYEGQSIVYAAQGGTAMNSGAGFRTAALADTSQSLKLNLTMNITMLVGNVANGAAASATPEKEIQAGPFNFSFDVPLISDLKVVPVNQTAAVNGLPVTLERIEISPAETDIYLRANPPTGYPATMKWQARFNISGGSGADAWAFGSNVDPKKIAKRSPYYQGVFAPEIKTGEQQIGKLTANLYNKADTWQITIHNLVNYPDKADGDLQVVEGPWVFTVNVP